LHATCWVFFSKKKNIFSHLNSISRIQDGVKIQNGAQNIKYGQFLTNFKKFCVLFVLLLFSKHRRVWCLRTRDFCRKSRLLQNRSHLCQYNIFFHTAHAEMFSTYPIYTICFCLWTFFKMAEIFNLAFGVNIHVVIGFSHDSVFY
jgi:hypothetical protein